jgi:hypothetical protein
VSLGPSMGSPIASVAVESVNRKHTVRRNWIMNSVGGM